MLSDDAKPDIGRIIREYGDQIYRICYLYLKDFSLSEDAAQETFIKVYNKYNQFDNKSSEKTWITKIAINICKDYLRTSWFKRIIPGSFINKQNYLSNDLNVESDVILCEENQELYDKIVDLKPKYKEVILLYYYQKCTTKEIANMLKVPEGTVCIRLARAREILKKTLNRGQ